MEIKTIRYKRAAKVATAQFENTDIEFEMEASLSEDDDEVKCARTLRYKVDALVRAAIDDIDLDKVQRESKAGRFGVGSRVSIERFIDVDD